MKFRVALTARSEGNKSTIDVMLEHAQGVNDRLYRKIKQIQENVQKSNGDRKRN